MSSYYSEKLAGDRLQRCYQVAPPPVQHYLAAEIEQVRQRIRPGSRVLELGCGYGRVLRQLAPAARLVVGIDLSLSSLLMARHYLQGHGNVTLAQMNAVEPALPEAVFDLVCCIQNGISAFQVDQRRLLAAAVRVTAPGGAALFSSYAEAFWEQRLHWFRIQADHGLVGEIDETATGNGVIVCKDGFRATTVSPERMAELARGLGVRSRIETVAGASVLCTIEC
jgi:2-polyprenyl-6-hydroxyphenyl methylase/3-demethylubiquinone-9 3-methyltransferase